MSIIPWSSRDNGGPMRRFRQLQDEFADMFRGFPGWPAQTQESGWFPAINVKDNDKQVIVTAELPGVEKNDLQIDVTGETLTIRGERKEERTEKGDNWWRRESSHGAFMRRIPLPSEVDSGQAEARMNNGVLEIRLPKTTGTKSKSIKIT